jgi:hypothetical protein
MAGRKSHLLVGVAAVAVLGAGALWLRLGTGGVPERRRSAEAAGAAAGESGRAPAGGGPALPAASPGPGGDAGARGAAGASPPAASAAAARPAPDEGPGGAAWRKARVAFQLRELGRMAPYVKTALDDARREMAFCFRGAAHADAGGPAPDGDAPAPRPRPAILLLYLEAREGALDVVDTRTDHLGDASPEVVECCREVLRGLEIPAFGAVPGARYRLKLPLD